MKKIFVAIIFCLICNTFCFASGEELVLPNVSGEVLNQIYSGESGENRFSGEVKNNENSEVSGDVSSLVSGSISDELSGENAGILPEPVQKEVPKFVRIVETVIMLFVFYKMCGYIKESGKVFKPEPIEKVKYCKNVPIEGMTVGQASFLKDTELMKTSNVFLGNILTLKQKGNIELAINGGDVCYKILDVEPDVFVEEKVVYDFLNSFAKKFSRSDGYVSLRSLQKVMMMSSGKVAKLKDCISETVKKSLLYYNDEKDKRIFHGIRDIAIYVLLVILVLIVHKCSFGIFNPHTWIIILSIINVCISLYIVKNTVIFDEVGMETREKTKAFQRYMLNFTSNKEAGVPELETWRKNLNFALGFGVVEKVIEQIKSTYPNFEETTLARECLICKRLIALKFNQCFTNAISFKIFW